MKKNVGLLKFINDVKMAIFRPPVPCHSRPNPLTPFRCLTWKNLVAPKFDKRLPKFNYKPKQVQCLPSRTSPSSYKCL